MIQVARQRFLVSSLYVVGPRRRRDTTQKIYIKVGVNTNRVPRQVFAKAKKKDVIMWHCHRVWLPTLPAGAIWPEHGGTERRRAPNVRQRPRRRRQRTKSIWLVLDDATCPLRGREWSVSVVSFHRERDATVRRVGFYAKEETKNLLDGTENLAEHLVTYNGRA